MKPLMRHPRGAMLLVLAVMALALVGCKTTDPENASERPWNAPQGWENGVPGGMYQNH